MVDLFRNGYQRFRVFVDIALRQINFWVSISGVSGEYSVHYTIFFFHAWFKFEFKKKRPFVERKILEEWDDQA